MKKNITLVFLFFSLSLSAQWNTYNPPSSLPINEYFKNIYYTDSNTIWTRYASYAAPTYKSIDGGVSFDIINTEALKLINPINDSIFFALSGNNLLLKSNNGGISFKNIPIVGMSGDTGFLNGKIIDAYFYNENDGWVIGNDTSKGCIEVWTTNDGAETWGRVSCEEINISRIPFIDTFKSNFQVKRELFKDELIFKDHRSKLSNGYYNHFIRVRNQGKKWESFSIDTTIVPANKVSILAFAFIDSMIGLAATTYVDSSLVITTDGGVSWKKIKDVPFSNIVKIEFAKQKSQNKGFLIAANTNSSYISYDTAKTWIFLDDNVHSSMVFHDAEHGISMTQPTSRQNGTIRVFNGSIPPQVGIQELLQSDCTTLMMYPNPAHQTITFNLPENNTYTQVAIVTIDGKEMQTQQLLNTTLCTINIVGLSNGLYIAKLFDKDGKSVHAKIVVQKD